MAKKKAPAFKLDVDTRWEFTGRGTVTWFKLLEADDYEKIGGNFFPKDSSAMEGVVADLLAEAQAQCDEAGIEVATVDPIKTDDDGNTFYKVNRKAIKANGDPAIINFKDISGKKSYELDDELGNGSEINMKYYASAYYMAETTQAGITIPARIGVSLSPFTIQVIDHKIYEDGDDFGNEAGDMEDGNTDAPFDGATDTSDDDY
jgi:hypothetical protein